MADKIEEKALALVKDVLEERGGTALHDIDRNYIPNHEALCRAIEAHEAEIAARQADKQAFSDAVEAFLEGRFIDGMTGAAKLKTFIIKKPDPLESAWNEVWEGDYGTPKGLDDLRQALAARGLKIVEANNAPL